MTIPLYMHDAYLKEMEATIIDVAKETDNRWLVVLDKTIFYPRGGGQSTDQGILFRDTWKGKVSQALQKEDKIIHFVEGSEPPQKGTVVKGTLDWDRRYLHMRLHSAGHVVDFALYLLRFSPIPLMPFKGDHGKKPVIYYQGTVQEDFRETLEQKANELISKNLPFSIRFATYEELERGTMYDDNYDGRSTTTMMAGKNAQQSRCSFDKKEHQACRAGKSIVVRLGYIWNPSKKEVLKQQLLQKPVLVNDRHVA